MIKLADELELGAEFVTSTNAILGRKGFGKTNTAVVAVESLLAANQHVVVVDPTGVWWGLRSNEDGTPAYPVPIIGGKHGDVPLEKTAGEVIAQSVVDQGFSCVLDLSAFRKGELRRFMADFLETLYRLNERAIHLVVDEADLFAPQKMLGEEARVLGAMQDIVRRGRAKGIGTTMITQRPQVLNKDVLSQCDMVTVLNLNHPLDLKAVGSWLGEHADPKTTKKMLAGLSKLKKGEAWFWHPVDDIFKLVKVHKRSTFDSSRTPKPGEKRSRPTAQAVDVTRLGEAIQATVEEARANDPRALKAEIARLKEQVSQQAPEPVDLTAWVARARQMLHIDTEKLKGVAERIQNEMDALIRRSGEIASDWEILEGELQAALTGAAKKSLLSSPQEFKMLVAMAEGMADQREASSPPPSGTGSPGGDSPIAELTAKQTEMLRMLKRANRPLSRREFALYCVYTERASSFLNNVSALRTKGYLQEGWPATLTDFAQHVLEGQRTGVDKLALRGEWRAKLTPKQRQMFDILLHNPKGYTRAQLAGLLGYTERASSYLNNMSALRTKGLAEKGWPARLVKELL